MNELETKLRELLASSACELLDAYAQSARVAERDVRDDHQLCAILGFTGAELSGCVIVAAAPETIAASNPIEGGALNKWIAELTNQLVGRFANALLRRGIEIGLSVPVALSATRLSPLPQRPIAPIVLELANGLMTLWLEVEGDAVLGEVDPDLAPSEGEALLF